MVRCSVRGVVDVSVMRNSVNRSVDYIVPMS